MTDTTTEQEPKLGIFEAIPKIMADMGAIAKTHKNPQGWYFRGIDDFYNALQPLMAKYKIFPAPVAILAEEWQERQTGNKIMYWATMTISFRLYAADGSYVEGQTKGEAGDYGDKVAGKVMSYAMKAWLTEIFCVPTEDTPDPDANAVDDTMAKDRSQTPPNTSQGRPPQQDNRPQGRQQAAPAATQQVKFADMDLAGQKLAQTQALLGRGFTKPEIIAVITDWCDTQEVKNYDSLSVGQREQILKFSKDGTFDAAYKGKGGKKDEPEQKPPATTKTAQSEFSDVADGIDGPTASGNNGPMDF